MMSAVDKLKAQLVIVTGFIALFIISKHFVFIYIAGGVAVCALFIPFIGDLIVKGWYKLADILGWVNSRIILSLVFIIFLIPISFLSRLFKGSTLNLKREDKNTLFYERNHTYTKDDIQNPW